LVNPRQVNFNKTKAAEESSNKFIPSVESWNEKRKGLGTVKQAKRKALKLKDKTDTLIQKYKNSDHMINMREDFHKNKNPPGIFRSPIVEKGIFFNKFQQNDFYEESEDALHHFPDIIEGDNHEEVKAQYVEPVTHKLPDLSNKYRKMLKESSSDEFDPKPLLKKEYLEDNSELEQKLSIMKEPDINKNHTRNEKEIHQTTVNKSRSLIKRGKKFK